MGRSGNTSARLPGSKEPPDDVWYYADQTGQIGPFTLQEIQAELATIRNANDLFVWREGMSEWQRIGDIPALRTRTAPPPLPQVPSATSHVRSPFRSAFRAIGWALVIFIGFAFLIGLSSEKNNRPPTAEEKAKTACREDYMLCRDNADMINNYSKMFDATYACKQELNKSVKFGEPEWSWVPFGSFYPGNDFVKTGLVKIVDKDVKIQNAFGAKVNSVVECWYDFHNKTALIIKAGAR
jgi:hypothetical protein